MRILLADDQPKVRLGLRLLLEQERDMIVAAEAADAGTLLAQTEESRPDLVLLAWSMGDSALAEQLTALRQACPRVAVIVLSAEPGVEEAALAAGADAFVSKADPPELLLEAIAGIERDEKPAFATAAAPMDDQSCRKSDQKMIGGTR